MNKNILVISPYDFNNNISGGSTILNYYYNNLSEIYKIDFVYVGLVNIEFSKTTKVSRDYRFRRNIFLKIFAFGLRKYLIFKKNYKYYNSNLFIYFSLLKFLIKHGKNYNPQIVILEWFDLSVHLDLIKKYFPNSKVIVSFHDVCSQRLQRLGYKNKIIEQLISIEKYVLNNCDHAITFSDKDFKILKNISPQSSIQILTPFYQKHISNNCNLNPLNILFYGNFYRSENCESLEFFYNHVFLKYKLFKFKILVLGAFPLNFSKKFRTDHVEFLGYVDNPDLIFSKSLALLAPLSNGAGIKIKILESFASKLPVITNEIGIEGICSINDTQKYFLYAKQPDDYYKAITLLATNPELRNNIINNAFTYVNNYFNYEKSLREYINIINHF